MLVVFKINCVLLFFKINYGNNIVYGSAAFTFYNWYWLSYFWCNE